MTRFDNMYKISEEENSRGQEDKSCDFDWLPGFKEMMACQESQREEGGQIEPYTQIEQNGFPYQGCQLETDSQPDQDMPRNMPDSSELLPPEELQREEQMYWKDYEYFLRMLPVIAREIWAAADAILDRYEFEGSSMYAEYPDKTAIFKIVEMIYDKLKYYENNRTENKMDGT